MTGNENFDKNHVKGTSYEQQNLSMDTTLDVLWETFTNPLHSQQGEAPKHVPEHGRRIGLQNSSMVRPVWHSSPEYHSMSKRAAGLAAFPCSGNL